METYFLKPDSASARSLSVDDPYRPLFLLHIFRSALSLLFCLLYLTDNLIAPLGSYDDDAFFHYSGIYFSLSLVLWSIHKTHKLPFHIQVWASVLLDIVFLTLLMHTSGGIQSGLGVLIVVSLASASIVMSKRTAFGLAAVATLTILSEQVYIAVTYPPGNSYPFAGLLGITYFATTLFFVYLAGRLRESESLAQERSIDLANLAQLTEHIIQRMQTGVLVIDGTGYIRLINESASQMLGINEQQKSGQLDKVAPTLAAQWHKWQTQPNRSPEVIQLTQTPIDLLPRFAKIGDDLDIGALIFLQDMAAMAQHAQQLQLASLGRLTASIAHEIRNPLGAISHAGQLLAESDNLDKNDTRLTQIISEHSKRLNTIVENVMSVSRRNSTHVELLNLHDYVSTFVADYCSSLDLETLLFEIDITPADTQIRFDPSHLQQILNNLCNNAIHHSRDHVGYPKVSLRGGISTDLPRPYLDIFDKGPGVNREIAANIFEPFFTTESQGTGLGLYLSRELAEGNQAHLNYIYDKNDTGFFRITFQDPRRQFK